MYNPLEIIGAWDIVLLHIGALLRMLIIYKNIRENLLEKGKVFKWSKYIHDRGILWAIHYLSAWGLILSLPYLTYLILDLANLESIDWMPFWSGVTGFAGYDVIRLIEWLIKKVVKEKGYDPKK